MGVARGRRLLIRKFRPNKGHRFECAGTAWQQEPTFADLLNSHTPARTANQRQVPKRLQSFFKKAEDAHLLTEDAVQAILNLVDPFPDDGLQAVGWPSFTGEHTLPMILTDYLNIAAPANVTKTWNFKVLFIPFSRDYPSNTVIPWDRATGTTGTSVSNAANYGQFNIWTWRSEDAEPDIILTTPTQRVTLDPNSGWSHVRITHAGFEAINTSADLYRGGMYYGYRTPLMSDPSFQAYPGTAGMPPNTTYSRFRLMAGGPDRLGDIINLSTTVSGSARNGVGVFSLPMAAENPFTFTLPTNILLAGDISAGGTLNVRNPSVSVANPFDWMLAGAYVTGLAAEATFQLKMRIGYELMPGADASQAYQAMARKPVPRSYLISEMLDQLLMHTPAAFDYSENPLGEWFGKILQGLSAVIPAVANFIPHPVAKIIGGIAAPALYSTGQALRGKDPGKQKPKGQGSKVRRAAAHR